MIVKLLIFPYTCNKGDYQSFTEELLNTDWKVTFDGMLLEDMWSTFHERDMLLISKYIPTQFDNNSKPTPQWMNKSALYTIKKKRKAWLKFQSTLLPTDYIECTKCRNASTQAARRAKYSFDKGLINDLSVSPKRF